MFVDRPPNFIAPVRNPAKTNFGMFLEIYPELFSHDKQSLIVLLSAIRTSGYKLQTELDLLNLFRSYFFHCVKLSFRCDSVALSDKTSHSTPPVTGLEKGQEGMSYYRHSHAHTP